MSVPAFQFAVIADSHIRRHGEYSSEGAMVERNRYVVDLIN
ncbi:MAG TPA: hypothetical protein VFD97_04050 [Acidimicrobiia bacterium]|nr:hypothetical protein [Acidimicrobiia bacterium]